jgi:hypothetical protein
MVMIISKLNDRMFYYKNRFNILKFEYYLSLFHLNILLVLINSRNRTLVKINKIFTIGINFF